MAGETPPGVRLGEGEAIELRVETYPCQLLLTNQRLIVWQRREGVEQVTPIALERLLRMEVREERGQLWPLLLSLGLCVLGALLLPQLVSALGGGERGLLPLGLGALGVGLVVVGLVSLSLYLRRALFPQVQVVFQGAPQVVVEVPSEARRQVRRLAQRLKQLKAEGGEGPTT